MQCSTSDMKISIRYAIITRSKESYEPINKATPRCVVWVLVRDDFPVLQTARRMSITPARSNQRNRTEHLRRATAKELRQLVVSCHRHNHAGTNPAVRVTGKPSGDEDASLHDRRECIDTDLPDSNDEGSAVRVVGARRQSPVVQVHDETDQ